MAEACRRAGHLCCSSSYDRGSITAQQCMAVCKMHLSTGALRLCCPMIVKACVLSCNKLFTGHLAPAQHLACKYGSLKLPYVAQRWSPRHCSPC